MDGKGKGGQAPNLATISKPGSAACRIRFRKLIPANASAARIAAIVARLLICLALRSSSFSAKLRLLGTKSSDERWARSFLVDKHFMCLGLGRP
jgi:hypothetical protein